MSNDAIIACIPVRTIRALRKVLKPGHSHPDVIRVCPSGLLCATDGKVAVVLAPAGRGTCELDTADVRSGASVGLPQLVDFLRSSGATASDFVAIKAGQEDGSYGLHRLNRDFMEVKDMLRFQCEGMPGNYPDVSAVIPRLGREVHPPTSCYSAEVLGRLVHLPGLHGSTWGAIVRLYPSQEHGPMTIISGCDGAVYPRARLVLMPSRGQASARPAPAA
jgi:hypothetical protein